jgi:HEAT repeat protein
MKELESSSVNPTVSGKDARVPAGDDLLPPVEPPSAGFIIQLFVVPALIVMVIVAVWFTFTWLVRRTTPEAVVQGLEHGPSVARWQRASELADMLRNRRFPEFKRSSKAADNLARILERELEAASSAGGMEEEQITLRYFLTRALGEFEVQEGLDALLKAAETDRHPSEQLVRSGALEAIAVRAYNLHQLDPPQELVSPELMTTLARLAKDDNPLIRSKVAYALGQIGSPAAIEQLELLVDDPDADTRYNAAVALAHHGNGQAVDTLAEMLDLTELPNRSADAQDADQALRRAVIVGNALQAVEVLAQKNQIVEFGPVIDSLEQLAAADAATLKELQLPARILSDARRTLESLSSRGAGSRQQLTQ